MKNLQTVEELIEYPKRISGAFITPRGKFVYLGKSNSICAVASEFTIKSRFKLIVLHPSVMVISIGYGDASTNM